MADSSYTLFAAIAQSVGPTDPRQFVLPSIPGERLAYWLGVLLLNGWIAGPIGAVVLTKEGRAAYESAEASRFWFSDFPPDERAGA